MNALKHIRTRLLGCSLVIILQSLPGFAQQNSDAAEANLQETAAQQDGQHDFDWDTRTWKTLLKQ
jgi:hypothetical protein